VILKISYYFLILFLLQSCSGGRIGNFLELSFKNIEQDKSKIDSNDINNEKVLKIKKNLRNSSKPVIQKTNKDFSKNINKMNIPSNQFLKSEGKINIQNKVIKKNISQENNKIIKSYYEPQAYRVIIILKGVDPKSPSQDFSNILKNANINFEIEKIERLQENNFKKLK